MMAPPPPAVPPAWTTRRRIAGAAIGVAIAAASALATWTAIRFLPVAQPQPVHFAIVTAPAAPLMLSGPDRDVAISPDGTSIVYRGGSNQVQLMIRAIDQLDARPLANLNGTIRAPFFSPDGKWVGFFTAGGLQKVSITGGPPISICAVTGGAPRGATWGPDDTIVFATTDPATGLMQVSAGGGEPKALTRPDTANGETDHVFPSFLPGGRAVLYTVTSRDSSRSGQIAVLDVKSGQRKTLVRGGSQGEYAAPPPGSGQAGHLIYAAAGMLRAVRFDPARLDVLGDIVPVVDHVIIGGTGAANYAVSRNGTLLYVPGGEAAGAGRPVVWVDRQGREEPLDLPARAYVVARLSPDGARVALDIRDQDNDIWIWDFARRTLTRLTFDPTADQYPVWTPDGRRIIFSSLRGGGPNLYSQVTDGTGSAERLTTSPNLQVPNAITPDGTRLVHLETSPKTGNDLVLMNLGGDRHGEPLVATPSTEANADISPDGRWIAYQSSESGQDQVYVQPFPRVETGRWQVSARGGSRPVWGRNGRELFYLEGSASLMAVPVQTAGSTFSAGNPTKLFEGRYFAGPSGRLYDVARDGQRFLMIKEGGVGDQTTSPASMVVVLNWTEELRQRVGGK